MENFRLKEEFFKREDTQKVAKDLLGKILVREHGNGREQAGMIVEVESYHGFEDKASHASRNRTTRNEVMFGEGGHYYVYFIYGMYWNLNVVSGSAEFPSAILIRALEPIYDSDLDLEKLSFKEKFKLVSGPGKLCRWMDIDKRFYGKSVENNELFLVESLDLKNVIARSGTTRQSTFQHEKIASLPLAMTNIAKSKRIGVDYAGESANLEWRYYFKDSPFISKKYI